MSISIFYNLGASTNVVKTNTSFQDETGIALDSSSQLKMFNILKDLSARKKSYTEASLTTPSTSYEIETFLNIWRSADVNSKLVNNTLAYNKYIQNIDENWDNIATKYYENDGLWWTIALTNNITNPFEEGQVDGTLKILKSGYLFQLLKDVENISKL